MAKRESQGLLVAVILLVLFSLLMSIFTMYFWNQSSRLRQELESAQNSRNEVERLSQQRSRENQLLKTMLGHTDTEKIETIEGQFAEDMKLYGEGVSDVNKNYRDLPAHLVNAIGSLHTKLNQANEAELQLKKEKEKLIADGQARAQQAQLALQELTKDKEAEISKWKDEFQKWKTQTQALQNEVAQKADELNSTKQALDAKITEQAAEIKALTLNNRNLAKQLEEFKDQSFDTPDGEIVWVNQRAQIVQLNLGRADGLQRQVSFSVFDVDENNLAKAKKKGSIEVTRILDDHRAEARITEDQFTNPIVPGDFVYSPLWQPGMSMRFALAGFMDIDGDGSSDRQLIKNLIALNGGKIDAEVSRDAGRSGELSIRTRYLVLGDRPKITQNVAAGASDAEITEYGRIIEEAKQLGVQQLPVKRLLSDLGYRGSAKAVALGKNAREQDFDGSRTRQDTRFRPRRPRGSSPY